MSKKESGFAALPLVVAVLVLSFALALRAPVTTTQNPDVKGTLIAKGDDSGGGGSSGGGGDSGGGSHDSGSSGSSSGGDNKSGGSGGSSGAGTGGSRVEAQVKVKVEKPEKIEVKNEVKKPEAETETDIENEIEKPETEKVHINISSAGGELEVETETASPGGVKTRLRLASLVVGTGSQSGQGKIKIQIHGDQFEFESQGTSALTNFPLTFDKTTNTLLVNTPDGPRPIRVLPDQAASAASENGFETQVEKIELATASAGVTTDSTVFKISGKRTGNLLGLIPVSADVETQVGAQSGTVLFVTQPLWLRLFSGLIR